MNYGKEPDIHYMTLSEPYFTQMKNKEKLYELRIYDEKRRKISVGDFVLFTCGDEEILVQVCSIAVATKFKDLVRGRHFISSLLPGVTDAKEAIAIYKGFPDYREKAKKYGVIMFGVILLDPAKLEEEYF